MTFPLTLTNYEKDYCKQKFINLLGVRQDFLYLYQKLGVSYQIQIILSKKLIAYTGESPSQFKLPSEKCVESIFKRPGRTEFQRGILFQSNGMWKVKTTGKQGSGILSSMSKANCFIVLSMDIGAIKAGEIVDIQLLAIFI